MCVGGPPRQKSAGGSRIGANLKWHIAVSVGWNIMLTECLKSRFFALIVPSDYNQRLRTGDGRMAASRPLRAL